MVCSKNEKNIACQSLRVHRLLPVNQGWEGEANYGILLYEIAIKWMSLPLPDLCQLLSQE